MRALNLHLLLQQRRRRQFARQRSPEQPVIRLVQFAAFGSMLLVSLAILLAAAAYADLTADLPPVARLTTLLNPDDGLLLQPTRLYDRSGQTLLLSLIEPGAERRYLVFDPQKPDHFSPFLIQATIGGEEPGFWQSPGADWQHLLEAEPRTIAERLVERLLLSEEPPGLRRSLRMRLLAAQVTSRYGRAQVLEWHLNSAFYGRLAYGAESAARLYLGKSAAELSLAESVLLVAAYQAPALNPLDAPQAARERQLLLLQQLQESRLVDAEETNLARRSPPLLRVPPPTLPQPAPAFTAWVLEQLTRRFGRARLEQGGLQVTTSLDLELQNQLVCTLQTQLERLEGRLTPVDPAMLQYCRAGQLLPALPTGLKPLTPSVQGSAILLDPSSGQVLALVGDSTSLVEGSVMAGHAPGSLLTPFLAVSAFSRGFSPASLVWDIPPVSASVPAAGKYAGPLRLRQALAGDIFNPLEQLLEEIGPANVWRISEPLGLGGLGSADSSKTSLLQGGGSLRLLDLAQAYSAFANLGSLNGSRAAPGARLEPAGVLLVVDDQGRRLLEPGLPDSQAVLSAPLAYLVHHVLSDEPVRWPSLGYPNLLEIGRPAGAKLGRTADSSQAWAVGYTPQRLAVVWLGLPATSPAGQVIDVRAAAGVWHAAMQYTLRELPSASWSMPPGISQMEVCSPSGLLPTRACPNVVSELFLNGNEPTGPDSLYRIFQVNRETGRLATIFTPPELVEERTYLVLPVEAEKWGQSTGLPVPPQDYDRIQPPAALAGVNITSPAQFAVVRGKVTLRGSAGGDNFSQAWLQAGEGLNPSEWLPIGTLIENPIRDGSLGIWDTGQLNGLYAIRLQVVRKDNRLETAILQVTVDNAPPRLRLLSPQAGQALFSSGSPVRLQVDASDAVGIQAVQFSEDGILLENRTNAPYLLTYNPQPGRHSVVVTAVDLAGNTSELKIEFTVQ